MKCVDNKDCTHFAVKISNGECEIFRTGCNPNDASTHKLYSKFGALPSLD